MTAFRPPRARPAPPVDHARPARGRTGLSPALAVVAAIGLAGPSGCTQPFLWWNQEKPVADEGAADAVAEWERDIETKFIADVASPWNINFLKVEGIGFVSELAGTGSDPPASPLRDALLAEMRTHEVDRPEKLLATKKTSLVLITGFIPPGAKPGDRFDLEITLPPGSETLSLAGGWLFTTRLKPREQVGGSLRAGDVMALGEGQLLVDAVLADGSQSVEDLTRKALGDGRPQGALVHAVIPGGGVVRKERTIGLTIRGNKPSARIGALVTRGIDRRFSSVSAGKREADAKMLGPQIITVGLPSAYQRHPARFYRVLGQIALVENEANRTERLTVLETQLNEPTTSRQAAIRLESVGRPAIGILETGLKNPHADVRFYAAEALAYLDQKAAVAPLKSAVEAIPAVRPHALAALGAMSHLEASEALDGFLASDDAALRMAAFRVILDKDPKNPYLVGESVREEYHLHVVDQGKTPLVHIGSVGRADVVLFGQDQTLRVPAAGLFLGKGVMIQGIDDDHLRVSRFRSGAADVQLETTNRLAEVCQAVGHLGGGYPELVHLLRESDRQKLITARVATNVVQTEARSFAAETSPAAPGGTASAAQLAVEGGPLPLLFEDRLRMAADLQAAQDLRR